MKVIGILIIVWLIVSFSCSKSGNPSNTDFLMKLKACVYPDQPSQKWQICFDSLITDSRCPKGAECIWQGVGTARFSYVYNGQAGYFSLSTNTILPGTHKDTVIGVYRITLKDLYPYPGTASEYNTNAAALKITRE